jgi:hypothetical protein
MYNNTIQDTQQYIPEMFITPTTACQPLTAAAAWNFVPLHNELKGNP